MNWEIVADVLAAVCLLLGAFLTFAAGVGVLRFPDLLARMHAATKPQVLGLILMLTAEALRVRSWKVAGLLFLVICFQLLTAPVAAHMVGRAGVRTGQMRSEYVVTNELEDDQNEAEAMRRRALERDPQVNRDLERKLEARILKMRAAAQQGKELQGNGQQGKEPRSPEEHGTEEHGPDEQGTEEAPEAQSKPESS